MLAAGVPGCGSGGSGETFAIVHIDRGSFTGPIDRIDLTLMLGGQAATRSLTESGADIKLPTEAVFHVLHGEGTLSVSAIAFKSGAMVSSGSGMGTVTRGENSTITVTLGMASPDGGVNASPDAAGPQLAIDQTSHDFGGVVIGGAPGTVTLTVRNSGSGPTGALNADLNGAVAFTKTTSTCDGAVLQAAQTCTVTIAFTPTTPGPATATLMVSATPGGTVPTALSGSGLVPGSLAVTPTVHDFGMIATGMQSPAVTFTVSNPSGAPSGSISVTLAGSNMSEFSLASDNCTGLTLPASGSCTVSVRFSPITAAAKSANLAISASPGGPLMVPLTGTGVILFDDPDERVGESGGGLPGRCVDAVCVRRQLGDRGFVAVVHRLVWWDVGRLRGQPLGLAGCGDHLLRARGGDGQHDGLREHDGDVEHAIDDPDQRVRVAGAHPQRELVDADVVGRQPGDRGFVPVVQRLVWRNVGRERDDHHGLADLHHDLLRARRGDV